MKIVVDEFERKYLKIGKTFIRWAIPRECRYNGYWDSGSSGMYQRNTRYFWITLKNNCGIMWHRNWWLNYTDV